MEHKAAFGRLFLCASVQVRVEDGRNFHVQEQQKTPSEPSLERTREALPRVRIRPFADRDEFRSWRERLAELYREAYRDLQNYAYREKPQILRYLDWLYDGDPEHFYVAWNERGEPVGFISGHSRWLDEDLGQVGNIHEMVVHPDWRGRGVGRALFDRLAADLAAENPVLILWVGEGNHRARAMYERRGFKEIGRQGKWIKMMRESSSV